MRNPSIIVFNTNLSSTNEHSPVLKRLGQHIPSSWVELSDLYDPRLLSWDLRSSVMSTLLVWGSFIRTRQLVYVVDVHQTIKKTCHSSYFRDAIRTLDLVDNSQWPVGHPRKSENTLGALIENKWGEENFETKFAYSWNPRVRNL